MKGVMPMAKVDVNYTCGCGYTTKSLEEAVRHSEQEQHTLTVLGAIRKEVTEVAYQSY